MKGLAIGLLIGAGVVAAAAAAVSEPRPVQAQARALPSASEGGLVVLTSPLADGGQQLLTVDPVERVLCVYHIGPKNGEITLKSVRNIHWDLRMTQFNGVSPLPEEIRSLVEQR